ncbi:MAG: hypothetical protein US76_03215 [Parcubacteria group bacterium GW2011_GWA2_38_13b]|nr:MAG: hypothetical protein US76_03215 [Parcubacteria group bacterium GW2011_GWA2_38_13b]
MEKRQFLSELRRDLVTGDWVLIAKGRAKRPNVFADLKKEKFSQPIRLCPFEAPQKSGNLDPLLVYDRKGRRKIFSEWKDNPTDWFLQVLPNKFPAIGQGVCEDTHEVGPYLVMDGVGSHEVVITRNHTKHPGYFSGEEMNLLVGAYKERYLALMTRECVKYISIFHNNGRAAGASLSHPHSQIMAIPIVPLDIRRSLGGSEKYYQNHKKCVHCVMLEWEITDRKRIIFENELAIAFCPFISRAAFEIKIFPKIHQSYFEKINENELKMFSEVLRISLAKLRCGLNDPDYNFYIHTAPVKDEVDWHHYHWHVEILPKTGVWAGFELGTGIEISTIEPEKAAEYLRKVKV